MDKPIPIVFQDDHIIIALKPPDVLVHPNPKDRISSDCVTILSQSLEKKIYTVHRLDRGTSGVIIFALNREAADGVARQFRERSTTKRYYAIVRGHIVEKAVVTKPLVRLTDGELLEARSVVIPHSTTVVHTPVGPYDEAWYSFVGIDLHTGRTHQARKHLKSLSSPVIGDNRNGDRTHNRFIRERYGVSYLCLRSYELSLVHPVSGKKLVVTAGFPSWWLNLAKNMELEIPETLIVEPSVKQAENQG